MPEQESGDIEFWLNFKRKHGVNRTREASEDQAVHVDGTGGEMRRLLQSVPSSIKTISGYTNFEQ